MALNSAALKSGILYMFNNAMAAIETLDPYQTQAELLATAIDSYFQDAGDIYGNSLLTANKVGLQNSLISAFQNAIKPENQNASYAATELGNAIVNYISSAIFSFSLVPPGGIPGSGFSNIVTAVSVPTSPLLLTIFLVVAPSIGYNAEADIDAKAESMATAIHTTAISGITSISFLMPGTPPIPTTLPGVIV